MRSSNPIFRDSVLERTYALTDRPMTIAGTMNKLILLAIIMCVGGSAIYYKFLQHQYDFVTLATTVSMFVSLGLVILLSFKMDWTKYIAPLYAFLQGVFLFGVSCFFEQSYPGIVMQAVSITFITVFAMAALFIIGAIKATEKFKAIITTATLAIMIFYLISIVLTWVFHINVPYFTSTSTLSIVINVAIAIVAALNLIIDFDFIDRGVKSFYPAEMEWYGAFGLVVTIAWLYIEILRLLSRFRSR